MKKSPTEEYAYDAVMELLEQKEREMLDRLVLGGLTAVIEPRDGQNSGASDAAPAEVDPPIRQSV